MKVILPILLSFLLNHACVEDVQSNEKTSFVKPKKTTKEVFDGLIISSNATKLRAPINYFSVNGWTSSNSWIKLKRLAEDGKEVKKGDVIGGFEFKGEKAFPKIKASIQRSQARLEKGQVADSNKRRGLAADMERAMLDSQAYALDLSRGQTVSNREMKNFLIQKDLADFDARASGKFLKAQRVADSAVRRSLEKELRLAKEERVRFDMFKRRFSVLAPHDGIVRHGRHVWRNRKVQQGDGMPSGMNFASIAKDAKVEITILVPEKYYDLVNKQKEYFVRSPSGDERYAIDVTSVETFPQTVGFVKQDTKLPNAQEIVYVVHAAFRETIPGLNSGLEVKVELP